MRAEITLLSVAGVADVFRESGICWLACHGREICDSQRFWKLSYDKDTNTDANTTRCIMNDFHMQLVMSLSLRFADLWFRSGAYRLSRPSLVPYDTGSRDAVLPCSWDPDGCSTVHRCYWHLVGWVHHCRVARETCPFPGQQPSTPGFHLLMLFVVETERKYFG